MNNKIRLPSRHLSVKCVGQGLWKVVRLLIIVGLCFEILYPFFGKILKAFMSTGDLVDPTISLYPKHWDTYFWERALYYLDYGKTAVNSLLVSVVSSIFQLIICTMVGYGFARFKFRGRDLLFGCVMVMLLVPNQVLSTPMYLHFRFFSILGIDIGNLIDTIWPYAVLSLTGMGFRNGLFVYLMRQHFRGMPKELEEAASIDGCGTYATFFRIMLPNATNMIVTVVVLSFAWQWTDVFYSALLSNKFQTLPLALLQNIRMVGIGGGHMDGIEYSVLRNTASLIVILPLVLLFMLAQRRLISGIERSGIVG